METAGTAKMLFERFSTGRHGLEPGDIAARREKYGPNLIASKKKKSSLISFFEEFKDLMVIILIVAAILAFIGGESRDGIIILFIVVLNAAIGFIQKHKAEKAIEALARLVAPKARVIRGGKETEIDAGDLVPGDIIVLREGDSVTADALLFEVNELETQESALTGESVPVQKLTYDIEETKDMAADKENMVFMGTGVTHGNGIAVVAFTGMNTEMGKIAKLTSETKKALSPLEKELFRIGMFVGKIAFVISAILLAVGVFVQGKQFIETLLFATSVAVAAVPEGLPATITIALAIGVQRLARKKAIVKQLSSAETLGSTTVICSDKTGTLTKNEMTVKEIYLDKYEISVRGVGYAPVGSVHIESAGKQCLTIGTDAGHYDDYEKQRENLKSLHDRLPDLYSSLELFMLAAGLCNNARLSEEENVWKVFGDPTEGALLTMVEKTGFDLEEIHKQYRKVHEITFDSTRKRMTVIFKDIKSGKHFAFAKGAPDSILEICHQSVFNGNTVKLDRETAEVFHLRNNAMAEKALRGLGFAYRELTAKEVAELEEKKRLPKETVEHNLVFLGLAGMIDPPRPEVQKAVEMAHTAGIRTYIITGDHGLTAEAIAKQLNLIGRKRHTIITGETLDNLSDKSLSDKLANRDLDIIFARVSPEHKLRVVDLLEKHGEVVAVTGDGVNDAPALKRADIGIAMGISGTDVSKEASDMVLADDSYSTIVTAVREGRTIYANLHKFIFYVFSCNFAELLTVFAAILMALPAPLTAILILCINLGTDVLPAVALGIEPPEPGTMHKKPRDPKSKIMNPRFIGRFMYLGILMGIIVMGVYIWTLYRYGWSWGVPLAHDSLVYLKASSVAFVQLIIIQMVNAYNSRSEVHSIFRLGFFSNPYLLGAIAISVAMTIALVEIPFLQGYLDTTGLNLIDWAIVIGSSLLVLAFEEVRKALTRRRHGKA
jgi:potassium/sodium efflux P-type ATPase